MNLFAKQRLALVLERLLHTWRRLFSEGEIASPNDSAIHQRRDQLGVAPMVDLFHRVCRPLASQRTRGAFLLGLRKMAMARVSVLIEEEDVPLVECLLHIRRALRTPAARIIVHHQDGVPQRLEVNESLRIADLHRRIKGGN